MISLTHQLPHQAESKCSLAICDICALDTNKREPIVLSKLNGVVGVLHRLESHHLATRGWGLVHVSPVDAPGMTLSYACSRIVPSRRSSKRELTAGCTSREFSQRVKTRASRSPSASKSSTSSFSSSVIGSSPGWVLNRLATKARFSLGFPATREVGVRNFRQSSFSAF